MATVLFGHAACLGHVTPPGHPERVARLEAVAEALARFDALDRREAPLAERGELLRCHPESYVAEIEASIPASGSRALDADTHVMAGSLEAALRAVGAVGAAVDAVMAGAVANAFCAVRPPGHHAERETPMGFCLFGSVAIGAKRALEVHGLERVAVVDFDVHHGNGTQDLLWDEGRALFVSSHQMPLWPGTGAQHEAGAHGNVMNVPLPPGTAGAGFRRAYETQVFPALRAFAPQMVLISAGFDAHADDPLAQLGLREADFAWVTKQLCDIADATAAGALGPGRVVSVLEGGYDLAALAASAAAHVEVLVERGQRG
ncbi:MAG: histone deacetylase family protein [Pseudomonadota bacterium]